jgi:DNA-binding transcriptional LysR family regulator
MSMPRFRRVAQLWNWLPSFRGVAEHESLQKAASALGVSGSALSRTVKLLEDALGAELFVRHPGGLRPTPLGAELLAITRDAMRHVDDCIAAYEARREGAGPLLVGVTEEIAGVIVARALSALDDAEVIHIRSAAGESIEEDLLQGNLDLALTSGASQAAALVSVTLGAARFGLYCAADAPLAKMAGSLTAAHLAGAALVAPASSGPLAFEGARVAVVADSPELARILCERSHRHVAMLPDALVEAVPSALVRLADAGESVTLHAVHRKPIGPSPSADRVRRLVAALKDAV